jgi:hypothetical protein
MKVQIFIAGKITLVFWVMMLCSLVAGYPWRNILPLSLSRIFIYQSTQCNRFGSHNTTNESITNHKHVSEFVPIVIWMFWIYNSILAQHCLLLV